CGSTIHRKTVVCMTAVFQKGIKQCTLLPHVPQGEIGTAIVYPSFYPDFGRTYITYLYDIAARRCDLRKVQPVRLYKRPIWPESRRSLPLKNDLAGSGVT